MAQLVKLIAHGILNGQRFWGADDVCINFLRSFYGKELKAKELIVNVMPINGQKCCFFTYVCADKASDKSGRAGGYLALTVKMNCMYADLQNMYNILDAAYRKFIVGRIISQANRFLIDDFSSQDEMLKRLEQDLNTYIEEFSDQPDLVSCENFAHSGNSALSVNLLECTANLVQQVMKGVVISVSPQHPNSREQQLIQKHEQRLQAITKENKDTIRSIQSDAERRVADAENQRRREVAELTDQLRKQEQQSQETLRKAEQQAQANLKKAKEEAERRVEEVRKRQETELQTSRSTISQLRSKVTDKEKQLKETEAELTDAQNKIKKSESWQEDAKEYQRILKVLKDNIIPKYKGMIEDPESDAVLKLLYDVAHIELQPKATKKPAEQEDNAKGKKGQKPQSEQHDEAKSTDTAKPSDEPKDQTDSTASNKEQKDVISKEEQQSIERIIEIVRDFINSKRLVVVLIFALLVLIIVFVALCTREQEPTPTKPAFQEVTVEETVPPTVPNTNETDAHGKIIIEGPNFPGQQLSDYSSLEKGRVYSIYFLSAGGMTSGSDSFGDKWGLYSISLDGEEKSLEKDCYSISPSKDGDKSEISIYHEGTYELRYKFSKDSVLARIQFYVQ